jgi:hypothetical protein
MIKRYEKTIDAIVITLKPKNLRIIEKWTTNTVQIRVIGDNLAVKMPDGKHIGAEKLDYLVKHKNGSFQIMKADDFAKEYL